MEFNRQEYIQSIRFLLAVRALESGQERRFISNKIHLMIYVLKLNKKRGL